MLKDVIVCELCFESIARLNVRASRLWIALCGDTAHGKHLIDFQSVNETEVNLLERMGFILSSEIDMKSTKIIVRGTEDTYFCINEYEHCEE